MFMDLFQISHFIKAEMERIEKKKVLTITTLVPFQQFLVFRRH